jgi:hypothetical protein
MMQQPKQRKSSQLSPSPFGTFGKKQATKGLPSSNPKSSAQRKSSTTQKQVAPKLSVSCSTLKGGGVASRAAFEKNSEPKQLPPVREQLGNLPSMPSWRPKQLRVLQNQDSK